MNNEFNYSGNQSYNNQSNSFNQGNSFDQQQGRVRSFDQQNFSDIFHSNDSIQQGKVYESVEHEPFPFNLPQEIPDFNIGSDGTTTSPQQQSTSPEGIQYTTKYSTSNSGYEDGMSHHFEGQNRPQKVSGSKKIRKSNRAPPTKCNTVEEFLATVDRKFVPDEFMDPNLDPEVRKKMMVQIRNRAAAQKSRDKKSVHFQQLEDAKYKLMQQVKELTEKNRNIGGLLIQLQEQHEKLLMEYKKLRAKHESYIRETQIMLREQNQRPQFAFDTEFDIDFGEGFGQDQYLLVRDKPRFSGQNLKGATLAVLCMVCCTANFPMGQLTKSGHSYDTQVATDVRKPTSGVVGSGDSYSQAFLEQHYTDSPDFSKYFGSALHVSYAAWTFFALLLFLFF